MDRLPPQNIDAEKILLCSLIIAPDMYNIISGIVNAGMFYPTKHQHIFTAIETLNKRNNPVDIISISSELKRMGIVVSKSDLIDIASVTPTGANAEYHAKIVAEKAIRRRALEALRAAELSAYDDGHDILDIISTVQKDLEVTLPMRNKTSDIYPEIIDIVESLVNAHGAGEKPYLATGFTKIDKHTKLRPGELTVIAADAGEGKTSLMLSMARHMIKNSKRPLFVTLEMTKRSIIENIIAQELGLCHQDMIGGELSDADLKRLTDGINRVSKVDIGVVDEGDTTTAIRHHVINEYRNKGIDCLMVDSLGKIKGNSKTDSKSDVYNEICSDLVDIAKEFKIPVILAHHLNKNDGYRQKNKRPTVDSLNQAGDRWTHNVLLVYRPVRHVENPSHDIENIADIIIGKARDGQEGVVQVRFDGPTKTFQNLAREG